MLEVLNGHQSILHQSGRGPHSQISELELYNHVVSYRAHVVEPKSLLPRMALEQEPPRRISLQTGAHRSYCEHHELFSPVCVFYAG